MQDAGNSSAHTGDIYTLASVRPDKSMHKSVSAGGVCLGVVVYLRSGLVGGSAGLAWCRHSLDWEEMMAMGFVESGWASVKAERGASPGVVGDIEALGEDAVSSVTRAISSVTLYLEDGSRLRWGSLARLRSPGGLSMENSESLALEGKWITKLNDEMQQSTKTDTYPPYPGGPKKSN